MEIFMNIELRNDINNADMILIGLGEETVSGIENVMLLEYMNKLAHVLEKHNYFIVATFDNVVLRNSELNQKRIVYPYKSEKDEYEGKQWDLYNRWLSATLAKKLLIIEAGEGFVNPNVIRWPFERITMINNKASFMRIHSELAQIPAEIQNKAKSINKNAFEFLKEWLNDCE